MYAQRRNAAHVSQSHRADQDLSPNKPIKANPLVALVDSLLEDLVTGLIRNVACQVRALFSVDVQVALPRQAGHYNVKFLIY